MQARKPIREHVWTRLPRLDAARNALVVPPRVQLVVTVGEAGAGGIGGDVHQRLLVGAVRLREVVVVRPVVRVVAEVVDGHVAVALGALAVARAEQGAEAGDGGVEAAAHQHGDRLDGIAVGDRGHRAHHAATQLQLPRGARGERVAVGHELRQRRKHQRTVALGREQHDRAAGLGGGGEGVGHGGVPRAGEGADQARATAGHVASVGHEAKLRRGPALGLRCGH
mmetsp:Transcript_22094/g.71114  ORF Transcript_22094/g.71114 Transcript_22094/m.71114 type:complete len:225 (-) Transcript_22094:461-1135(-)